jgi:hypothetical protein
MVCVEDDLLERAFAFEKSGLIFSATIGIQDQLGFGFSYVSTSIQWVINRVGTIKIWFELFIRVFNINPPVLFCI